jgi:hypothetical protein
MDRFLARHPDDGSLQRRLAAGEVGRTIVLRRLPFAINLI